MADVADKAGLLSEVFETFVAQNQQVSLPGVSGLHHSDNGKFAVAPLLTTSDRDTWMVMDDGNKIEMSVPVALSLTRGVEGKAQKILVVGDADFLGNDGIVRSWGAANTQLVGAMMSWFSDGALPLLDAVHPPTLDDRLTLAESGLSWIKTSSLGGIAPIIALFGGLLLLRRRKK